MIDEGDVERVADAASGLPAAVSAFLEDDYVMNLLATVLDYQMHTTAVVKALEHFRESRGSDIRTIEDVEAVLARHPDTQPGNTELAQYLWANNHWRRASELRRLTRFFRSIDVIDQESLRAWARTSEFRRDFEGRVKGLGPAVYQGLVMRVGVDTVKPDVHVRRFAEAAVGRPLSDIDVIDVVSQAAGALGIRAFELDWRIWEASRSGSFPIPHQLPDG